MAGCGACLVAVCCVTGVCGVRVCVCVHAWAGSGRCARALLCHRLFSVVYTTHNITSITFVSSMTFFIFCITTASATLTTATATSPSNQLILEHFGGVDANSLCNLDNLDEPDILQLSSYYDDDSLNTLFTDKADYFSILS